MEIEWYHGKSPSPIRVHWPPPLPPQIYFLKHSTNFDYFWYKLSWIRLELVGTMENSISPLGGTVPPPLKIYFLNYLTDVHYFWHKLSCIRLELIGTMENLLPPLGGPPNWKLIGANGPIRHQTHQNFIYGLKKDQISHI